MRYADDFQVYVKSKRAGKRVMESLTKFLEDKLHLKVNQRKSAVDLAWKRTFLGFSFYKRQGEVRIRLAPKTLEEFKENIREETSRRISISMEERIDNLNRYLKGWIGYFHIVDMKTHLKRMRSWIRRRLRMCIWKQWKNVKTRIRKLKQLGLSVEDAIKYGNSRKGYWRLSNSYQINSTLDNKFWSDKGLVDLVAVYSKHR